MPHTHITLPSDLINRLTGLVHHLDQARPLPAAAVANLAEQYRLESTYNTNAIEGNTLSLPETRLVLETGLTVGGKPMAHHLEATNSAAAWDRLEFLAGPTTPLDELLGHTTLQELHGIVMKGLATDAGRYRTVNVRIVGRPISPPDWAKVFTHMEALLEENRADMVSIARHDIAGLVSMTARFHHGLEAVHPFSDGNGRVGRLALNLVLLHAGLVPVIIRLDQRKAYYRALAGADRGNLQPLALLLARALQESLARHLGALGDEEALLPLKELAARAECPYNVQYLALRALQGKLAAVKLDNLWHASPRALADYMQTHGRI